MNGPLISIITVCYNAEAAIEVTLRSVTEQTYPNIEYLIVDGASKDATLAVMEKYKSRIARVVSEKDKGIYDAMNKGLALATGEFVLFMNAGDTFHAADTVEQAFAIPGDYDVRYGETRFVNEDGTPAGLMSQLRNRKLPTKLHWKSMQYGQLVGHQSIFVRRSLAPLYSLDYLYAADTDWKVNILKKTTPERTLNTGLVIADFKLDGFSQKNVKRSWKDRYQVLKNQYGFLPNLFNHAVIVGKAAFHKLF